MAQRNNRLIELATEPVARLLWRYSMPAVVGMVVNSLYNVIDRIFIGRGVGADAIAGLAITFPVMNLVGSHRRAYRSRCRSESFDPAWCR